MLKFQITQPIKLANRALLHINGADAAEFLQGQISNDIDLIKTSNAIHALILTPQGKILADLFVYNYKTGYLLELDSQIVDWLIKRLQMYRLRSDVSIEDLSQDLDIVISQQPLKTAFICAADPRLTAVDQPAPLRNVVSSAEGYKTRNDAEYQQYLAQQAMATFGVDYQAAEFFPQDLWYDKLASTNFTKGCYVGQEVVSRMRHKSTARKRLMPLFSRAEIQLDQPITYQQKTVGQALSQMKITDGYLILAVMRQDKLPSDTDILDDVEVRRPAWTM
ncbi:MAG: folate-binding protein YgfZ [Rhizobiales bacterium]|nr:hypothetical protein [Hyphomicrobiales bacterium]NRB13451.1 folate-binding protein YgfZ [Hyphomicrobiales bacterium]